MNPILEPAASDRREDPGVRVPGVRVQSAIRKANERGRPALTAFVTAGYPSRDDFVTTLRAIAAVVDVVEVGVPFSDPMADGVTIQRASRAALASGVTLPWILSEIGRAAADAPIVLMSYLNPLLSPGLERVARDASEAGVDGFIIPDLPFEESLEVIDLVEPHDIGLVQFVTPVTPDDRLVTVCGRSRGFVYAVTRTGTTGGSFDPKGVARTLRRIRASSPVPVQAGFGVREPAQVRVMAPHVDGLIVGSALVECLERGDDPTTFLRTLRDATPGNAPPSNGDSR